MPDSIAFCLLSPLHLPPFRGVERSVFLSAFRLSPFDRQHCARPRKSNNYIITSGIKQSYFPSASCDVFCHDANIFSQFGDRDNSKRVSTFYRFIVPRNFTIVVYDDRFEQSKLTKIPQGFCPKLHRNTELSSVRPLQWSRTSYPFHLIFFRGRKEKLAAKPTKRRAELDDWQSQP